MNNNRANEEEPANTETEQQGTLTLVKLTVCARKEGAIQLKIEFLKDIFSV